MSDGDLVLHRLCREIASGERCLRAPGRSTIVRIGIKFEPGVTSAHYSCEQRINRRLNYPPVAAQFLGASDWSRASAAIRHFLAQARISRMRT